LVGCASRGFKIIINSQLFIWAQAWLHVGACHATGVAPLVLLLGAAVTVRPGKCAIAGSGDPVWMSVMINRTTGQLMNSFAYCC
jgi:hypothetical protein